MDEELKAAKTCALVGFAAGTAAGVLFLAFTPTGIRLESVAIIMVASAGAAGLVWLVLKRVVSS